ncbi:MAG TPA: ferritin-like domain-containing protein [Burkholderiales bacterium]|nr:ferritin-like domain-containing protein [Burkholderiales bacterium]
MNSSNLNRPAGAEAQPNRATPTYSVQNWGNGRWDIQQWLERTAWRTLKDTEYGRPRIEKGILPELFSDGLLRQVCLIDIATFIEAERTSFEAVAGLLRCAPDENSKVYLGTQVMDECRHFEVFCRRMADFGISPEERNKLVKRFATPAIRKFYDLVLEQVDKRDFIAGCLAQNIVMEGMSYPVYRYEIKYWSRIDSSLSQIIRGAFADEVHHVSYGEAIIKHHIKGLDPSKKSKLQALISEFSGLMTEAFEQVISHYIGLYQECANEHMSLMANIEIFPGRLISSVSEEDQVRLLLGEIRREHAQRAARIGLSAS